MNKTLAESEIRVFYRDEEDSYFECFTDKTKKEVDRDW